MADAEATLASLAARIEELERRVGKLEAKQGSTRRRSEYKSDGSMRCPYADIPGEKPCRYHRYDGCTF